MTNKLFISIIFLILLVCPLAQATINVDYPSRTSSGGSFDSTYLRLDATNDPLTGDLQISDGTTSLKSLIVGEPTSCTLPGVIITPNKIMFSSNEACEVRQNGTLSVSGGSLLFSAGYIGGGSWSLSANAFIPTSGTYPPSAMQYYGADATAGINNTVGGEASLICGKSSGNKICHATILASPSGASGSALNAQQLVADFTYKNITYSDGVDFIFNTGTGSKIGTTSTQKIGLWGATPVTRPAAGTEIGKSLSDIGAKGVGNTYTIITSGAARTGGLTATTIVGSTNIKTKAGTATKNITVGGTLMSSTTSRNNSNAAETTLFSYSVPANTLATNNDSLKFDCGGIVQTSINTKQFKVRWGATTVFDSGALSITTLSAYYIQGRIKRATTTTQRAITSLAATLPAVGYSDAGETLSGAVLFNFTGTGGASNDISNKQCTLEWSSGG